MAALSPLSTIRDQAALFEATVGRQIEDIDNHTVKTQKVAEGRQREVSLLFQKTIALTLSYRNTLTEGDSIKEGCEDDFFATSTLEDRLTRCYQLFIARIKATFPAAAIEDVALSSPPRAVPVTVYYEGAEDLFIRGSGARIIPPSATCGGAGTLQPKERDAEELSWDILVPLTRVAGSPHLRRTTLFVPEGAVPEYKFSLLSGEFNEGSNYTVAREEPLKEHLPVFPSKGTSTIAVPGDVGYGNKLVIMGQGTLRVDGEIVELNNWATPLDLKPLHGSLWARSIVPVTDVQYKICLVTAAGELKWEDSPNRHLMRGQETVLRPTLPGITYKLPEVSVDELTALMKPAALARATSAEEVLLKARIKERMFPCKVKAGHSFKEEDILHVFEPARIDTIPLDGSEVVIYYTADGKATYMQETEEACSAASAAMLIFDHKKTPNLTELRTRKAASYRRIVQDIQAAGLHEIVTPGAPTDLARLKALIDSQGSAIVRIKEQATGTDAHFVVVDRISDDLTAVEIRDPWHAWNPVVKGEAFLQAWKNAIAQYAADQIVQIA